MALSADKQRNVAEESFTRTRDFDVAASTKIWAGALIGINVATGIAGPMTNVLRFVGVAREGFDNSGSLAATTGKPLIVELNQWELLTLAGVNPQDEGRPVSATADDAIVFSTGLSDVNRVGRIMRSPAANQVYVWIEDSIGILVF